jgi:hypothetical protein
MLVDEDPADVAPGYAAPLPFVPAAIPTAHAPTWYDDVTSEKEYVDKLIHDAWT